MALAAFANMKSSTDTQVLALGSDPTLPSLCEDMDGVLFAEDLFRIPPDLNSKVDLCIHSGWLNGNILRSEEALMSVDAVLSYTGKQIFTVNVLSNKPQANRQVLTIDRILEWLKQEGWSNTSVFDPDEVYGTGARELFGAIPKGSDTEAVIILSKRSV